VEGIVYVFGGKKTYLAHKYDLKRAIWKDITGATVCKVHFNPCLKDQAIYLAGGRRNSTY